MKNCLFHVIVFFFALSKLSALNDSTKVLFIGNSITYFNNMPFMFKDISNNKGKKVSVTMYAPGGTGFVNHSVDPAVFSLFRNNSWDIVVLQPGSGESAGSTFPVSTTVTRGKILLDSIYYYSPCAKVFLYQIPYGVPSASTYSTYFSVQTRIRDSVSKMTDSMHVEMIPAGECARAYYGMHPNLLLHGSYNDIHPNANGSFLVASACYTSIFQDTLGNCTFYSTVQQDTAKKFFSIVDTVVLNHLAKWRINTHNLNANFSFNLNSTTVNFQNQSSNFNSVLWHFGDGSTSTTIHPVHTYSTSGNYNVKLYIYNTKGCIDSMFKSIQLLSVGLQELKDVNNSLTLFPNPASTSLNLNGEWQHTVSYKIFGIEGKEVKSGSIEERMGNRKIEISDLQEGLYILQLYQNGEFLGRAKFNKQMDE